ncbi:putative bifunctional diguanylate cyclase/phosphodiesterase [Nitrincola alkalisediminis]|uniref:putative bifunctional diguanylate cyclase/phosphodiesterase n=1 Tax=Nitrincola alkalisediminis TaxID=1366656 RepID=UPI001874648B|nr:EAL domain-containing protein [Nitrincola alkalisediminis]
MKAGKTLFMLLILPATLTLIAAFIFNYVALSQLKNHFVKNSRILEANIDTLALAAHFNQTVAQLNFRVIELLKQADEQQLSEIELYYAHREIVDELALQNQIVDRLANSELVKIVNHGSAISLQEEFKNYRRLMIMSTEIIAIDPNIASRFFSSAQDSYAQFSLFSNRLSVLLTEQSKRSHLAEQRIYEKEFFYYLVLAMITASLLMVLVLFVSHRTSSRIRVIADALSQLAYNQSPSIKLAKIETLANSASGEFKRIADLLLNFRDDMVRRIRAEEENHRLIYSDALTGLPNRRLLIDRLEHLISTLAHHPAHYALLWIDMDRFKSVNDLKGHQAGDQILQETAVQLASLIPEADTLARVGGDEFALLLELRSNSLAEAALEIEPLSEKLCSHLTVDYTLEEYTHFSSASIGVTLFSGSELKAEALLNHAEIAAYQAKEAGRNTVCFYDPDLQKALEQRTLLENELRLATEKAQLRLYYQLQYNHLGRVIGAEALIRWLHPDKGLIPPFNFIPLAEQTGLIIPMGQWILKTACQQLAKWANSPTTESLTISVNVSARQFREDSFVADVKDALQHFQVNPKRLKLEITESIVLEHIEQTISKMLELRAIGVTFSMDDFGTGYSSLQYLKRLPLNQLKIDQSFVQDITTDNEDSVIVKTIIAMGQALSLEIIAEGVETLEQQKQLEQFGCLAYQGYYFAKPSPIDVCMLDITKANAEKPL